MIKLVLCVVSVDFLGVLRLDLGRVICFVMVLGVGGLIILGVLDEGFLFGLVIGLGWGLYSKIVIVILGGLWFFGILGVGVVVFGIFSVFGIVFGVFLEVGVLFGSLLMGVIVVVFGINLLNVLKIDW